MASNDKTITLITGANGGIGFALALLLLADASNFVLVGSRSLEKGQAAVKDLKERNLPGSVELVQIDVNSEDSVSRAAKHVEEKYGRIDALVNNAAITGEHANTDTHASNSPTLSQQLTSAFTTNTVGPAITLVAFAPLLSKSKQTVRVINVTSGAGSISIRLDFTSPYSQMKAVAYRVSKSALHMLTACQAYEYESLGWKFFNFCPGFTESNLSPMNKVENGAKPTSEGARPMVTILKGERDAEHKGFLNGTPEGQWPW